MKQMLHKNKRRKSSYSTYDFLRLVLLAIALSAVNQAGFAYDFIVDGITYEDNYDGTCSVSQYDWFSGSGTEIAIEIPMNVTDYEGYLYTVVGIKDNAFNCDYDWLKLKSITIPHTIKYIGEKAFYGCDELDSVKISSGYFGELPHLESIGNYAFYNCSKLVSVTTDGLYNSVYPEYSYFYNLRNIGDYAFYGCTSLEKVPVLTDAYYYNRENELYCLESIGEHTFENCGLKLVDLPRSVARIGCYSFSECKNLEDIQILYCTDGISHVRNIENGTFKGCEKLSGMPYFAQLEAIGDSAFYECYSLSSLSLNENLKSIGKYAFYNCSLVEYENGRELSLPNYVTTIGKGAFSWCHRLSSVKIPESLSIIEDNLFEHCYNLQSVIIPNSVTHIGGSAFGWCKSLHSIEIPNSVKSLGSGVFMNCENLTDVNIPESVTSLPSTFSGCSSLSSIEIPNSVTNLSGTFSGTNLSSIEIPNSVTVIGDYTFNRCANLVSINIPTSVTSIGNLAFKGCTGLTNIEIPKSVTSIGNEAFESCTGLTNIEIPNSVTKIGNFAFYLCSGLTSVTIPNGITEIGKGTFYDCSALSSINSFATVPPTCYDNDVFYNVDKSSCIVYVPKGSADSYKSKNVWKSFKYITEGNIPTFDNEEWNTIKSLRDELLSKGWDCPWDISLGVDGAYSFKGLTIDDRHVIRMDLSECNLTGDFPWSVLKLSRLEELNLSGNNLSGDIGLGMMGAIKDIPNAAASLRTVNISNNKFSGNIALFANSCPVLESLNASRNCISDVIPAVSPTVTTLDIRQQTIDRILDVDLANTTPEKVMAEIPTVLLYNHKEQSYNSNIELLCTVADVENYDIYNSNDWGIVLSYDNGMLTIPVVSEQNAYYGENGGVLNVMKLIDTYTNEGSTFRMRLSFASGDANFTGNVDVTDLQAIISQIHGRYSGWPFNNTAANIINDDLLNVQDVVGEVNLLLDNGNSGTSASAKQNVMADGLRGNAENAMVYCRGNELRIYSHEPVAAFDILVSNASAMTAASRLADMGITCAMRETESGTHIIGYSLSGNCLPAGETMIATFNGINAAVASAVLSDEAATVIPSAINALPTSITSASVGDRMNAEIVNGSLYITTDGSGSDVEWTVTALDGRILGSGVIAGGESGRKVTGLSVNGVVIVTLKSDNVKLTKKIINNK